MLDVQPLVLLEIQLLGVGAVCPSNDGRTQLLLLLEMLSIDFEFDHHSHFGRHVAIGFPDRHMKEDIVAKVFGSNKAKILDRIDVPNLTQTFSLNEVLGLLPRFGSVFVVIRLQLSISASRTNLDRLLIQSRMPRNMLRTDHVSQMQRIGLPR